MIQQCSGAKPGLFAKLRGLALWDNTQHSLALLCGGLLFFGLIDFADYSAITLLSYIGLVHICICVLHIHGAKTYLAMSGYAPPDRIVPPSSAQITIDPEWLETQLQTLTKGVNDCLSFCFSVAYCDSTPNTLMAAGGLITLSVIGRLFSDAQVCALALIAVMTVPKFLMSKAQELAGSGTSGSPSTSSQPHDMKGKPVHEKQN